MGALARHMVACILVFALSPATSLVERRFETLLYDGSVFTFAFDRHAYGECIYSLTDDRLFCVDNHEFQAVVSVWRKTPGAIRYVSMSCLAQELYPDRAHECFCKEGASSANPSTSRQHDRFRMCQVTELKNGTLNSLARLEVLQLSHNLINRIEMGAMTGLRKLKYLSLSYNPLTSLPDELLCSSPNLTFLELDHLFLSEFPFNIFSCGSEMTMVEYIDLSKCRISALSQNVFVSIRSVLLLNLSGNSIKQIEPGTFRNSSLKILDLSDNLLSRLPPTFCSGLENLLVLNISRNKIHSFRTQWIRGCRGLTQIAIASNGLELLFNDHISPTVNHLDLFNNTISVFPASFFESLPSLKHLDLSANKITEIGFLSELALLRHLNLSRNRLNDSSLDQLGVFDNLSSLEELDLSRNSLTRLATGNFKGLSGLLELDISKNFIGGFATDAFSALTSLRTLNLAGNKVIHLPQSVFHYLSNLTYLDLSRNLLKSVGDDAMPLHAHFHLNLNDNSLESIPTAFRNSSITELRVSYNSLKVLPRDIFHGMSSLEVLELSYNKIHTIGVGAFIGLTGLRNLSLEHNRLAINFQEDIFQGADRMQFLNLANNRIMSIDNIFRFYSVGQLRCLNLSNNPISQVKSTLTPVYQYRIQVEKLVIANCHIREIVYYAFKGLGDLKLVDLRNNSLTTLSPFVTSTAVTFRLQGNSFLCSCHMRWLKGSATVVEQKLPESRYQINTCTFYPSYIQKPIYKASADEFFCLDHSHCDSDCRCYMNGEGELPIMVICSPSLTQLPKYIIESAEKLFLDGNKFKGLKINLIANQTSMNTEELYLNSSEIVHLGEQCLRNFPHLRILHLDKNRIETLPDHIFWNLILLQELYINNNGLTSLPKDIFLNLKSLRYLDVSGNRLTHIAPESVFRNLGSLQTVFLGRNRWECTCENSQFSKWLTRNYSLVGDRRDVRCGNKNIYEIAKPDASCSASAFSKKTVVVACMAVVVLVAVTSAFAYRYRREVVAVLFVRLPLTCLRRRYDATKPFDAFLIYDRRDPNCKEWLRAVLLPRLEDGPRPYKVFVPERDEPQSDHSSLYSTSLEFIQQCRCTIYIVSVNAAMSASCSRGFQCALTHASADRKHRVLPIFFGNVDISTLSDDMKSRVKKGDYLTARGRFFWHRLQFEMPEPSRAAGKRISERDEERHRIIPNDCVDPFTSTYV